MVYDNHQESQMKNYSGSPFFNLSISFPPFIKGEMCLNMLLSSWQNNFWTCHFFIGVTFILLKLLKISNTQKVSSLKVKLPM